MSYQDEWVLGRAVKVGYRECESRYAIVRGVCSSLPTPEFSVCDIGANLCYFGIRITEDFPEARVTAFEQHPAAHARAIRLLAENRAETVELHRKRLQPSDVLALAEERQFDVVLALSVLHHVSGSFRDWLPLLQRLGRIVIVEAAGIDSARSAAKATRLPVGAIHLGDAKSHLSAEYRRSMVMLRRPE